MAHSYTNKYNANLVNRSANEFVVNVRLFVNYFVVKDFLL